MKNSVLADMLSAFTDDVNRGQQPTIQEFISQAPSSESDLLGLLAVIHQLHNLLVPLQAPPEFRHNLAHQLTRPAPQPAAPSQLVHAMWDSRRPWLIGAAVGSAVSVIGVAYVLRYRAAHAAHTHAVPIA